MSRTNRYQKKSPDHLRAYNRAIRTQRYEPTLDETLDFKETSEAGEDLSEPAKNRRRPINHKSRIKDHFLENWANWLVGALAIVGLYFMIDAKVELARVDARVDFNKELTTSLDADLDGNAKHDAEQDLWIQENRLRVQQLEVRAVDGSDGGGK